MKGKEDTMRNMDWVFDMGSGVDMTEWHKETLEEIQQLQRKVFHMQSKFSVYPRTDCNARARSAQPLYMVTDLDKVTCTNCLRKEQKRAARLAGHNASS